MDRGRSGLAVRTAAALVVAVAIGEVGCSEPKDGAREREADSKTQRLPASAPPSPRETAPAGDAPFRGPGLRGHPDARPPAADKDACALCKGSWGPHGMTREPSCLCATPDGGKACTSPVDCAGSCLVEGASSDGVRCGPSGCRRAGEPAPEPHGTCSPHFQTFGCQRYIVEHETAQGAYREIQHICTD